MTGSLRVALVYDDSLDRHGGIPQYLRLLCSGLQVRGHQVEVLTGQTEQEHLVGAPVHSLAANLQVRFNGNRLSMPARPRLKAISDLARNGGFDVVHVQVPYSPIMAGQLISRLPRTTTVVGTFHVASERLLPRMGARLLAHVCAPTLTRFDEIVSVSGHAGGFAQDCFGLRATRVVPNMVDLSWWRSPPRSTSGRPLIAFVGALVPRKGPQELMAAFARLRRKLPEARLVIAGSGPLEARLNRLARRLGVSGSVRLLGAVNEHEKRALLRSADVACYPSRFGESCGIVLLEAMAAGVPVVAGDCAGYAETLKAVPEALSSCEPAALADRMLELLNDPLRARRLVLAQHEVVQQYNHMTVMDQVLELYRRAPAHRVTTSRTGLALAA